MAATSPSYARSVLATTIRPEVSLSRRWTIPGRPAPAAGASGILTPRASTNVPERLPGAGCTTTPGGGACVAELRRATVLSEAPVPDHFPAPQVLPGEGQR